MQVKDAILNRKSVRDFLKQPVDINLVNQAIEIAKHSPSSTNMQPWELCIVGGNTKLQLTYNILVAVDNNVASSEEYNLYPEQWFEPFNSRRKKLGKDMYQAMGVVRGDKAAQIMHWNRNYEGFGADKIVFIFMDKNLSEGSYLDCGMFMQSLALSLLELGISSCMQASYITYSDIVKQTIKDKINVDYTDKILLAGIAIGYENPDNPVNQFRSERENIADFVNYAD